MNLQHGPERSIDSRHGGADVKRSAMTILGALAMVAVVTLPAASRAGCSAPKGLLARMSAPSATSSQPQHRVYPMALGEFEPIIGLWQLSTTYPNGFVDHVFTGWTRDGLEFDQDTASPILTGYVCYGTFVKIDDRTYGLTHPFFNYQDVNSNGEGTEATEGDWDGTSGYFDYTITVSKDGKSFTGKEKFKIVQGPNPYDPNATVLAAGGGISLSATKVRVDPSQLP